VSRVGQQRQAVGDEATHHLGDQEGGGESEGPPQRFLMLDFAQPVIVSCTHVLCS